MSHKDCKGSNASAILTAERDEEASSTQRALCCILEAWEEGVRDGVAPEHLAQAALYAALCDFVEAYGETATVKMIRDLVKRIEMGEFTINRTIQ